MANLIRWGRRCAARLVAMRPSERPSAHCDQPPKSRLPLRIPGGGTNRAVAGHSWGPLPVSTHGMQTFDANIGSRLQGLFLTDGFCTCSRRAAKTRGPPGGRW
jgi:hypothetical protein